MAAAICLKGEECKISKVVVYRDRAEVTRIIDFTPDASQINPVNRELVVMVAGITQHASLETVSVKPLVRGSFDILEVSHENVVVPVAIVSPGVSESAAVEELPNDEVVALNQRQNELEDEITQLQRRKARFEENINLTKSFAKNALLTPAKFTSPGSQAGGEEVSVAYAQTVLQFHSAELERLDGELFATEKILDQKDRELRQVKAQLAPKIHYPNTNSVQRQQKHHDVEKSQTVAVTIEIFGPTNVTFATTEQTTTVPPRIAFSVSYIVPNAFWSACYDARVSLTEEESLTLSYFAQVTQVSGEDWKDCDLLLSTSNPAISANPPPIKVKTVDFYRNYSGGRNTKKSVRSSGLMDNHSDDNISLRASFALMDDGFPGQQDFFASAAMSQVAMNETMQREGGNFRKANVEGSGDAGSTLFVITRKVTVASDNKPHKVLVMARRFKPQIVHYSVPSESPHVYIQAKVRNSSQYPLLPSDTVNIYVDGTFVSKSSLNKQANTGETFQLFLGVDPTIKVEYLPIRFEEYKKGWISGSEVKKVYHKTVVHNTKSTVVRIIIADALPSASNEKISIELMEPSPSSLVADSSKAAFASATDAITNLTGLNQENPSAHGNDAASTASVEPAWPADFVTKNKVSNNIIWFKTIKAGEKTEISFSYRLSWPQGQEVFINEK